MKHRQRFLLPLSLILLCMSVSGANAAELAITQGLADFQVLQRGADDTASVQVSGTSEKKGDVEFTILKDNDTVKGFRWEKLAESKDNAWQGTIEKIPVGGPYTIQIRLKKSKSEPIAVKEILVGDLWILAGQSNMQGIGNLANAEEPSPLVHCYEYAERWAIAKDPLHPLLESIDSVHWGKLTDEAERKKEADNWRNTTTKGAGVGLPFAKEMVERTGIPIGLVPCAHGGTSMDEWHFGKKLEGGASLYGSMLRRFQVVGGKVKGILWYQGESDAGPTSAPEFEKKFREFIMAVRQDFNQPDLPFYYVQIGRFIHYKVSINDWNIVQDVQRRLATEIPHCGMVPAMDLELDDLIHVGTDGLKRLGKRLANLACRDLFGETDILIGPSDPVAKYVNDGGHKVIVTFQNVNGKLSAPGRVNGFSIRNQDRADLYLIYDQRLDESIPNRIILDLQAEAPADSILYYGWGADTYCNIVDEKDMAVPAFGPIPVER
ncbi:MAG TPA: sialate O-acetylesterase [bacterium]|nr:sialate O-acetylesterase [bacterium]